MSARRAGWRMYTKRELSVCYSIAQSLSVGLTWETGPAVVPFVLRAEGDGFTR